MKVTNQAVIRLWVNFAFGGSGRHPESFAKRSHATVPISLTPIDNLFCVLRCNRVATWGQLTRTRCPTLFWSAADGMVELGETFSVILSDVGPANRSVMVSGLPGTAPLEHAFDEFFAELADIVTLRI